MPTAEGLKTQKQMQKALKGAGVHVELIDNPRAVMQWYRADGTPLPNLLPADEYHRVRYLKRGWTMIPPPAPVALVTEPDVASVSSGEAVTVTESPSSSDAKNMESYTSFNGTMEKFKGIVSPVHGHRYQTTHMGSPCKVSGCSAKRAIRFRSGKGRKT